MPYKLYCGLLAAWISLSGGAAADPTMTIDFSWQGTRGCVTLFPNPEIRIRNVPADAKLLLLTLTQGSREMGGEEVPLPANGIVPAGSIRTFGPCRPDVYRWTAVAKSATGKFLGEGRQARFYPTDELAPEKP